MNKLIRQIMKFGVVGAFCFLIDYFVLFACTEFIGLPYMVASVVSFTVSVVINYILSVKFVFDTKKDANKSKEFALFVILSLVGLGINQVIMWFGVEIVMRNWIVGYYETIAKTGVWTTIIGFAIRYDYMFIKMVATGIVMVYNFITRKIFLEEKNVNNIKEVSGR